MAQKGSGCPDDLVPKFSETKNWGYADLFGHWVIEPIYSKVSPFIEGKAVVQKGILCGVIDCEGNVILQCKYEKLTNFRNGKVWAMEKGLWGLIGAKGQIFQAAQFSEINPIVNTELTWVKKGNVWGLFNEERNNFICQTQYSLAQVMSVNATLVQKDKKFGVVNHVNCQYLLPLELTRVKKLAPHDIIFEQSDKWGVFNDLGKTIINAEFDTIILKSTDVLQVTKDGKVGLYTLTGKKILAPEYEEIGNFQSGYYRVRQNGKYGYCNKQGKLYIKPQYEAAEDFVLKQAIVKKGQAYGVIDLSNKFLLKPDYQSIRTIGNQYYLIQQNNQYSFYDRMFKKHTPESFDFVESTDTLFAMRVKKEGGYSYYNVPAKSYVTTEKFDEAKAFQDGFAMVKKANKVGVLSSNGKLIVPCQYDQVAVDYLQTKQVFRVVLAGKEGLADASGIIIIPIEYDQLIPALPNYIKAKKNGKYGVLRTNGALAVDFIYEYMSSAADHTYGQPDWPALVNGKGKYALINEKGEELYAAKTKEMVYIGQKLYAVKDGKTFSLVTLQGKVYETEAEQVGVAGEGLLAFRKGDKWGYCTLLGEEKIKPQYEVAQTHIGKMAVVKLKGKWGVIDRAGKLVVAAEYDDYNEDNQGNRYFKKGDKTFALMPDGGLK